MELIQMKILPVLSKDNENATITIIIFKNKTNSFCLILLECSYTYDDNYPHAR